MTMKANFGEPLVVAQQALRRTFQASTVVALIERVDDLFDAVPSEKGAEDAGSPIQAADVPSSKCSSSGGAFTSATADRLSGSSSPLHIDCTRLATARQALWSGEGSRPRVVEGLKQKKAASSWGGSSGSTRGPPSSTPLSAPSSLLLEPQTSHASGLEVAYIGAGAASPWPPGLPHSRTPPSAGAGTSLGAGLDTLVRQLLSGMAPGPTTNPHDVPMSGASFSAASNSPSFGMEAWPDEDAGQVPQSCSSQAKTAPASMEGPGNPGKGRTTLVLQGLPFDYSRDQIVQMLEEHGFRGHFDFVYVPCNFATGTSFGYAFVNMTSEQKSVECWRCFDKFTDWKPPCDRMCEVSWASIHGLGANIKRYRNSTVMHPAVPEHVKPIIFGRDGQRLPFPKPTRAVKAPKRARA